MDKNAIKKYAVWAREQLIEKVTTKAIEYAIVEGQEYDENLDSINGVVLTDAKKKQRKALIQKIKQEGYSQVIEEVAYTWFNRFIAIRFMEVNGYLPSHIRVFSDENGLFNPQILTEAIHLDFPGLDMQLVLEYKEQANDEELFKYLIKAQCNALNDVLPYMFPKIEDYTELLLPDNLLRDGSVISRLISDIPEDNFDVSSENGQVEIIGWLYQYYNDEKKDQVINIYKGTVKKEDVPAATQLFTTDWVVRYIVDNSIGKYWIERNPQSNLAESLDFFVTSKSANIEYINEQITPGDLTVLDPCMGSGHFLIYVFEVLMKIYVEYGFSERDAAVEIVQKNLFGLDIDERASQLSYFAVMMKARQYDRRFFTRGIQPNVFSIRESNNLDKNLISYITGDNSGCNSEMSKLINGMRDAKEYGSIIELENINFEVIENRINAIRDEISMYSMAIDGDFIPFYNAAKVLAGKYTLVITNPPYLNRMNDCLKSFINTKYKDYSGDLYSVFIYRNFGFCKAGGYLGFMTPYVWMFNKTYEKLRKYILKNKSISTLIQMEYSAFEEATVPICSFVLSNGKERIPGLYFKLSNFKGGMEVQKQKVLEAINSSNYSYFYESNQKNYSRIPTSPIAFWAGEETLKAFETTLLEDYGYPKQGFATGSNDTFMRLWHEVDIRKIGWGSATREDAKESNKKWFPCNKGGGYRRWYGNNYYLANWENDGKEMREFKGSVIRNPQFYFKKGMTWCSLTSGKLSMRYSPEGFVFESKGSVCYMKDNKNLLYVLALMNTEIVADMLLILSPTLDYHEGPLSRVPIIISDDYREEVERLAQRNIDICKEDWDSFEISWDFKRHPLVRNCSLIEEAYHNWESECTSRFNELKGNEARLNEIFKEIYHADICTEVSDDDVTVRKADLNREIKSLISYAVGCMFGRFSLEKDGIVIADCESSKVPLFSFAIDNDNIIPISDDEYFEDDIVNRFVSFISYVYGKDTLEDNLLFINKALGGKLSPRETLREYFQNAFYADHCSTYAITGFGKRPIYWMFDSGNKNGFKCLIYMHRYQPDTIARIRTDYVHEQQARYRTAIEELETRIEKLSGSDKVRLSNRLKALKAQDEEIHEYEEKIHHLADQMISINLDDGVKANYALFQDVLAKIK